MKRSFSVIFVVTALIILLGGQGVLAASPVIAEPARHSQDALHHQIKLRLVGEEEAVKIARNFIPRRQVELTSVRLTILWGKVVWEVKLQEKNRGETTIHQVMVDLLTGRVLDYKVNKVPAAPKPGPVDWKKAVEIARGEVARPVEVKATAHMKNSGLWTVNMAQRGADPAERIYVTIREKDGTVVERGRIKNGQVQVAQITPEQALAIARSQVNYRTELVGIGLVLERDTLLWEVRLSRAGMGTPDAQRFLIGAFTGRILAQDKAY
ncbi:MAG TPA: PepSY domain-containing protein [Firmicutes bacterium]|nr:PepSY domain-containing protein [Bacillota bacterium]